MATTEMNKLDAALTEMGIEHTYDREFKSGEQIVVTKNGEYQFDAICTPFAYGCDEGFLEVMGKPLLGHDGVQRYLTADDVLKMMKRCGQCV